MIMNNFLTFIEKDILIKNDCLEKYFVDGTKIESAANKYTFVWKKAIEKNEKKLDEKLKVFLKT